MKKYELVNQRTSRANGNKRWVDNEERLMQVAAKAGYQNIRKEISCVGNVIWVGDIGEGIQGGMFAVER